MSAVSILRSGMVTGVGLSGPATCAAIRCGIAGFQETRFMLGGDWVLGCAVPFSEGWRGRERLLQMVVPAIAECTFGLPEEAVRDTALLLCVAEGGRPGRVANLDDRLLRDVQTGLGRSFDGRSTIIAEGRVGGIRAMAMARELLAQGRRHCVVAGVDTYLSGPTLAAYEACGRLQTAHNTHGFIPGEAGAAVLLATPKRAENELRCEGIGVSEEAAAIESTEPLRADGLLAAIRAAFADSGLTYEQMDFRISDLSGEAYGFKEAALALLRSMRIRKEEFHIWHPADCIGQVGAAIVPIVLGVALAAMQKGYAPGAGALCHFANDDVQRGCLVLHYGNRDRN